MIKKIEGIVISEVDYKESSKIINVLTSDEGIKGFIARGTKQVKNKLNGVTSKLTYGTFHVNYKENGLSSLIEVDVIDNFKNIRKNIDLNMDSYYGRLNKLSTEFLSIIDKGIQKKLTDEYYDGLYKKKLDFLIRVFLKNK